MSARWLASLAALVAFLGADASAVAQSTTSAALELVVHVEPEGDTCLSEQVVRARVQKRLARDAQLSDVQVVVHIAGLPRLEVARGGQPIAERRFETFPTGCNARRDAIAVAVALAIERAHEAPAPVPAASAEPSATPQPASAPPEAAPPPSAAATPASSEPRTESAAPSAGATEPEPPSANRVELDFGIHAGVAAAFEILPSAAFAGVLGADLGISPYGLNIALSVLASLRERDEVLGGGIESQLLLGRLLAFQSIDLGGIALESGFGLLAGAVFARGDGYASDRSTQLAYLAPLARAALRFPAQNMVMARLALDATVAALRPSYAVRNEASAERDAVKPGVVGLALSFEIALDLL